MSNNMEASWPLADRALTHFWKQNNREFHLHFLAFNVQTITKPFTPTLS